MLINTLIGMGGWLPIILLWLQQALAGTGLAETTDDGIIDSCNLSPVLVPREYRLTLDPNFDERTFTGEVVISGIVQEETRYVVLDSGVEVTGGWMSRAGTEVSQVRVKDDGKRIRVDIEAALVPGIEYSLTLHFKGDIRHSRGIFGANYTTEEGLQRYFIASEFQPNYARFAFPCLDRPAYKAHFNLNISREAHLKALSNMPLSSTSTDSSDANKLWDTFEPTPLMSTYTFAFVIADLVSWKPEDGTDDPVNNTVWLIRGNERLGSFASKSVPLYMKQFEKFTGINYSLPKLDHVALPHLASTAMENWGLITYKQEVLQFNSSSHTVKSELGLVWILAHEMAHQWFGNLVTCSSWSYTWLNEGVTAFLHFLLSSKVIPEWNMLGLMMSEEVLKVMDEEGFSAVALTKSNCTMEAVDTFSMATYYKGAALMRMVYYMVGEEPFSRSLANYIRANMYGSVSPNDLWSEVEKEAPSGTLPNGVKMTDIMATWSDNHGFPFVTLTRHRDSFTLQQERLVFFQPDDLPIQHWWIPISYTTSSERNFTHHAPRLWLSPEDTTTTLNLHLNPNDWVVFNVDQIGYYRVLYDNQTWADLTRQLIADRRIFPPLTRAKLIDDVFTFAFFKKLHYSVPLSLAKYLEKETHYYPWSAAIRALEHIHFYIQSTHVKDKFEGMMVKLVERVLESVTHHDDYNESYRDAESRLLRDRVLHFACSLGHKVCEQRALKLMDRMLADDQHYIRKHIDEIHPLMCTMVRLGDEEIWNIAFRMYREEKVFKPKEQLMDALKCSTSKQVWNRLIRGYLDGDEELSGVDFFTSNMHDTRNYCFVVDILQEILEEDGHRIEDVTLFMSDLSGLRMPKQCKEKLKELAEKYMESDEEREDILQSLEKTNRVWPRVGEVEEWFQEETNSIPLGAEEPASDENLLKRPRSPFDGMEESWDMHPYQRPSYDYEDPGRRKPKPANSASSRPAEFSLFILLVTLLPSPMYLTYLLFAPLM